MLPILMLAACSQEYSHTETLTASDVLPEIGEDCAAEPVDLLEEGGIRVVTRVEPAGDACRASVYVERPLVSWAEVEKAIVDAAPTGVAVTWTSASAAFLALGVTDGGAVPPAGTTVELGQLLSSPSSADQRAIAAEPLALADDLAAGSLGSRRQHLISFRHELDGTDVDLAGEIEPVRAPGGPWDVVHGSWENPNDDALLLLTVANVTVPLDTLAELGATQLTLDVEEEVVLGAEVEARLFGGGI